MYGGGIDDN
jgi:UDP-2,3-diacylglucosamine pyrophosphatase LpxH